MTSIKLHEKINTSHKLKHVTEYNSSQLQRQTANQTKGTDTRTNFQMDPGPHMPTNETVTLRGPAEAAIDADHFLLEDLVHKVVSETLDLKQYPGLRAKVRAEAIDSLDKMEEEHALFMYHQMWLAGMQPDAYTFATLVKACSLLTALEQGRKIHANVMKWNCACDPFVTASLVDRKAIEGSQRLNALLFSLMPLVVVQRDKETGKRIVKKLFSLEPSNATTYVLLNNCNKTCLSMFNPQCDVIVALNGLGDGMYWTFNRPL
ncbi:Pentatricopeptide repeat-containing protein [Lathyrus oleraceus]|uniref:Pentatricopeptide repeat-containing protein n=1 Tax=Pisum sativum TaxID=3888 RepID=A0A9D5A2B8_PEA|nr:Pentatricopeptide repeat-containing protein [Pisum sativum]